jgi:Aerobic-type carbon monoxide dehydrogenase, large subunit CoxL/CutL homologs
MLRFDEHEVVIPVVVITELEAKRHHPELGYFARTALRLLDEFRIMQGRLDAPISIGDSGGTLHVELNHTDADVLPPGFRLGDNDTRILAVAERMLKISAQNLTISGDRIHAMDDESQSVTLREVSQIANVGRHGMSLLDGVPAGLETQAYFAPAQAAYTSGAHAALVEVDPETGGTTILRYVVGHDCGNVINPMIVDGQQLGGFAHGLGNAMYEEPSYDAGGQPQTTSYLDYALPSSMEVPTPGLFHLYTPSPLNPLGVKGAGESGTVPPAAAIGNAVEDALRPLGARITSFPVTPSKVSNAIHGRTTVTEATA